ncbi:alpha-1,6-glucosidase domain-containing protein [Alteromonas halophila]|uniref:Pullulanase n=1 Tax=Alteromonas halophila TaxID=516698 RepID=A0A918JLK2_9ALTE|nr:alpha-1,6-glucosidase domain-containing protein [Alteromonas halophila]GGW88054.1 pullulanase [Alteromonas halophila]
MFSVKRVLAMISLVLSLLVITGCGGSSDVESGTSALLVCSVPNVPNEAGDDCVPPPPIECDPPTVPNEANDACVVGADPNAPDPVFFPGENQAVLYYNRAAVDADNVPNDPAYDGWRLHTWNNDTCDAFADPDTDWASGRTPSGIDPNYGAYWVLDLKEGYDDCHNFIIHIGTEDAGKEMGGFDYTAPLNQDDPRFTRMNFTFSGVENVFEFPIVSLGPQPVSIEGFGAHWLDANTLLWDVPSEVSYVQLHHAADAGLEATLEEGLNGTAIELEMAELTEEQQAIAPHLSGLMAWYGDWSAEDAKAVLRGQAVLGGYNADGTLIAATGIQTANAIDQLYTAGEDDADEAMLGPVYTDSGITAAVWAPTAKSVRLLTFNDNKTEANSFDMIRNDASGVWTYEGDMSLDRVLYRYEVTVYHPITDTVETLEVTDPYSVSLSTNGRFSRFVNLNDDDLKPEGWVDHSIPAVSNPEDAVIYEGHIRDFSARDMSTSEENRGKYLAFTEEGTAPVMHLQKLVDAGVNYFHILPANDIATIDEDPRNTIDLYDTVADLCRLNADAAVCEEADAGERLIDVFNGYDPLAEAAKAQQLTNDLRNVDTFNWGYDPHHFNAPEGSYASSAEGVERIIEMRAMIQALHEMGLRVALDVVYNHTNASGVFPKSVLDKVVPGYYHRYTIETGDIVRETCCDDTEPRNAMMEKLMHDSLVMWAEQYKYDSFRFDIMSQASKDTMLRLREAVQAIDPDNYFYGEGWTKNVESYGAYEQANQLNMAGTEIGTFNDRLREAVRQGEIFNPDSDGILGAQDRVKVGMIGTLTDYVLETSGGTATTTSSLGGYAEDPADIINYVSKHDNETLWDQFNYALPMDLTLAERVRAQNIGISIPIMSQGIPFLQMGGDMLRSKSMDRNSYDSGDWFNYVDFTYQTNNWNVGLPPAQDNEARWEEMGEFIYSPERAASMTDIEFASAVFGEYVSIRRDSPLFRLTTGQAIIDRVGFHNIGRRQQPGLIAMSIDDGVSPDSETTLDDLDPMNDAIMVVVNSGYEEKSITVNTATGFELHMTHMNSVDPTVRGAFFTEGSGDDEGNGTFTVPALTMAVFVKPQMGMQGYGLSAYATSGAPDVVPYGDTTVYLRGGMNDWGTTDPMTYQGSGVYQVAVPLTAATAYEFKVASEDWSTVNLGAQDGESQTVIEDEEKVLAPSNNNLIFTPSVDATYLFTVDATDTGAPILSVVNEEPYVGTPVYVRGGFNGWGTDNELTYDGGRLYSASVDLDVGSYEFKVASEDWSTVNLGAVSGDNADRVVTLGEDTFLATSDNNLLIDIESNEGYVFIFDVTTLDEPKLRVFKEEFFGDTPVYLRGGMNGWGTDNPLVYQGSGVYTVDIDLGGGSTEFKVASEDWSTVNLGSPDGAASNEVMLDVPKGLAPSNNNLLLDVAAGTYEFRVEGPDAGAPVITVTEK